MMVVPVSFSVRRTHALQHCKWLLEETDIDGSSLVCINPCFDKLLISLSTAVATDYKLKKEETIHSDILDGFRLALQFYKRIK